VSEVNDWITKTVCKEVGELCPKSKSGKSGKTSKIKTKAPKRKKGKTSSDKTKASKGKKKGK